MEIGSITSIRKGGAWGFIRGRDERSYIFSPYEARGASRVNVGDRVVFSFVESPRGPKAREVRILRPAEVDRAA